MNKKAADNVEPKAPKSSPEAAGDKIWDVIVIGGGPAGMMAAGRAAEKGASVLLVEKNNSLGKKLLITGGGRCNVTNNQPEIRTFLKKFKDSDQFLFSAFSQWGVTETLDFFHIRKMETKVEALNRVFPLSNKAESVWNVLVSYLKENNVEILSHATVSHIEADTNEKQISHIVLSNKKILRAKRFILATGGKSHPETGSTGDGFLWLKKLGHKVHEPSAALVPIALKNTWLSQVQGTSLDAVKLTVVQNEVKHAVFKGRMLFTHFGISGPTVLNASSEVSELLKYGEVTINLDVLPSLDTGQLNFKLQEIFKEHSNKKLKNSLGDLIPPSFIPLIISLANIDGETACNSITRTERITLVNTLKKIELNVKGLLGEDKAIITSGGVDLTEVDFKTMSSRLYSNLCIVGDMLNIDRPSGGYSLQLCWTTGYVAGDFQR